MTLSAMPLLLPPPPLGVIPVLVGPMQAFLAFLPAIAVAVGTMIMTLFKPTTIKRILLLLWAQKPIVILIVAGIWGLTYAYGAIFPDDTASGPAGAGDWPLLRGGPSRRGATLDNAEDPAHGKVKWTFTEGKMRTFYSSPAIVGKRVYVTSARYEYFRDDGAIYSLDVDTGKPAWKFDAAGYRSTFSSPAVSGKYLVVGEGLHLTENARVFCLDKDASEKKGEGVLLWQYATKSHVESSPCIALNEDGKDGKAYIGAGDDGFYCFALEPDKDGNARMLWHKDGKQYPDCETSPLVHDGKVYFGLGIGGQAMVCLDAETGHELWRVETPYPAFGSPSLYNGKLFFGMGHGDFVNTAEQVAANKRAAIIAAGGTPAQAAEAVKDIRPIGEVWCVDVETHEVAWKFTAGRTVLGTVAAVGDEEGSRIYFGSRDGNVYCLDAEKGTLIRKYDTHSAIITSPAVARKNVYVVTDAGDLYGLDQTRLAPVWDVSLNSPSFSSPAVANGHVYVGTSNNGVLCVGLPGEEKLKPIWEARLGGLDRGGTKDGSVLPERGRWNWGYPEGKNAAGETVPIPSVSGPAAYADGAFYVGLDGEGSYSLARVEVDTAMAINSGGGWRKVSTHPVYLSALVGENGVYVVDGRSGDSDRTLKCLAIDTGAQQWERPVDPAASGEMILTRKRLFIADQESGLSCLDISGSAQNSQIWRYDLGGACVGPPLLTGDILVAAARGPGRLVMMDAATGLVLREQALPAEPTTGPLFTGGRVWVGFDDGVRGYLVHNGVEPLAAACGAVRTMVCDRDVIACVTEAGELVVIDPVTGEETGCVEGVLAGLPPLLADGALLYAADGSIQRYEFETKESSRWMRLQSSFTGNATTPMIMVNSHVLLGTERRGFTCLKPR